LKEWQGVNGSQPCGGFMKKSSETALSLDLRLSDGGYSQTFLSPKGSILLAGEPSGDILLQLEGKRDRAARYTSASGMTARLERPDLTVVTVFTEAADAQGFDVTSLLTALEPVKVISFGHRYIFPPGANRGPAAPLDYAWVPSLKSKPGDVIGDHVFRSPCIIAQHAGVQAALVPDLDLYGARPLRTVMDFDLPRKGQGADLAPRLSYAFQDYKPHGHVYYSPTGSAVTLHPGDTLKIGFTLLFDLEAGPLSYQPILRFLWQRYGEKNLTSSITPQVLPFEQYAQLAFESAFDRYGLWRGFSLSGKECGGICARIVRPNLNEGSKKLPNDTTLGVAMNYLFTPTLSLRDKLSLISWNSRGIQPHLWNTIFMNNMRTSFGLMYYARQRRERVLEERARAMWNLALAAPSRAGIFPSVFAGDEKHPGWVPGTRVWRYTTAYHTPNAAVTGWWMLAADRFLEKEGVIFRDKCLELGDFFRRAQLPSGAIPTSVNVRKDGTPSALPALAESASSAAAGMFLVSLFKTTGREEYLESARRIADFIIQRVFPRHTWFDTEVYFSCSPKSLGWKDFSTGIPPQGSLCISWTAELLGSLYQCTHEPRYLDYGRAALDLLLLFQQIWNAPFLDFDTRGGFACINNDAEWNDARQALFAPLLMDWYGITGEAELFQRGIAALRSAFTLMYLEEHRSVAPGNIRPMAAADRGAVAENYGHAGLDAKIQGYVMPDWGGGTAIAAAALAQIRWGDLYVDAARGAAFGVNGCRVRRADIQGSSINLDVDEIYDSLLIMKCSGISEAQIEVTINGNSRGTLARSLLEQGIPL
jgi:hypothetical protein